MVPRSHNGPHSEPRPARNHAWHNGPHSEPRPSGITLPRTGNQHTGLSYHAGTTGNQFHGRSYHACTTRAGTTERAQRAFRNDDSLHHHQRKECRSRSPDAKRLVLAAGCHENQPTKRNHVFERKKALKRCVANRPLQTMLGRFCKAVLNLNLRFPIITAYIDAYIGAYIGATLLVFLLEGHLVAATSSTLLVRTHLARRLLFSHASTLHLSFPLAAVSPCHQQARVCAAQHTNRFALSCSRLSDSKR